MTKRIGMLCMILGALCLLSAVGFVIYNRWEAESAAVSAKKILADVQIQMQAQNEEQPTADSIAPENTYQSEDSASPADIPTEPPTEMVTAKVDGDECIGILSIPKLAREFPVLTQWNYEKLKKTPCHYYGTCYEPNFVIAGHNYSSHFGGLSELQPGDLILFTDIPGKVHCYEVVLLETLPWDATEAMILSGFDLTLFTCTPGGANRVTVRCNVKTN